MIRRYAVLSSRIRQDLTELQRVVERVERASQARQRGSPEQDLLLDSVALNLHDVYSGLERIFSLIASSIDQSEPRGPDWYRELLRQMTIEVPGLRPAVLPSDMAADVDELLRFRHVVRHNYAFALEPERVERLAAHVPSTFQSVQAALLGFASFLDEVSGTS